MSSFAVLDFMFIESLWHVCAATPLTFRRSLNREVAGPVEQVAHERAAGGPDQASIRTATGLFVRLLLSVWPGFFACLSTLFAFRFSCRFVIRNRFIGNSRIFCQRFGNRYCFTTDSQLFNNSDLFVDLLADLRDGLAQGKEHFRFAQMLDDLLGRESFSRHVLPPDLGLQKSES